MADRGSMMSRKEELLEWLKEKDRYLVNVGYGLLQLAIIVVVLVSGVMAFVVPMALVFLPFWAVLGKLTGKPGWELGETLGWSGFFKVLGISIVGFYLCRGAMKLLNKLNPDRE